MYFSTQGSSLTVAKEAVLSEEGGGMIEVIIFDKIKSWKWKIKV